jgi:sugar-specific transcriptional regulator TrmB
VCSSDLISAVFMDTDVLRKLEFTENEIKVYLALLTLGNSSATNIAKTAAIHRSKAYDSLQRLIDKGIIHYSVRDHKRVFSVNNPAELNKLLENRQTALDAEKVAVQELIKEASMIAKEQSTEETSNVYEGLFGIKVFHNQVLSIAEKGDELLILGIPVLANELLRGYFIEFHRLRREKKIPARLIYSYAARGMVEERKQLSLTLARYLPQNIKTPAVIWLLHGVVGIFHFNPKPMCYEIRSKEIFVGFQSYFEYLWELSGD